MNRCTVKVVSTGFYKKEKEENKIQILIRKITNRVKLVNVRSIGVRLFGGALTWVNDLQ